MKTVDDASFVLVLMSSSDTIPLSRQLVMDCKDFS